MCQTWAVRAEKGRMEQGSRVIDGEVRGGKRIREREGRGV